MFIPSNWLVEFCQYGPSIRIGIDVTQKQGWYVAKTCWHDGDDWHDDTETFTGKTKLEALLKGCRKTFEPVASANIYEDFDPSYLLIFDNLNLGNAVYEDEITQVWKEIGEAALKRNSGKPRLTLVQS